MHDVPEAGGAGLFLRRAFAFVLDGLVLLVLGFVLLAVTTALLGPTVVLDLERPAAPVVEVRMWRLFLNAALLAALSGTYFVAAWTRSGSTPGQHLLNLVVIASASPGARASIGRASLRWALMGAPLGLVAALTVDLPLLFLAVSVASFGWFVVLVVTTAWGRTGRGLHDRLSGTIVTRRA